MNKATSCLLVLGLASMVSHAQPQPQPLPQPFPQPLPTPKIDVSAIDGQSTVVGMPVLIGDGIWFVPTAEGVSHFIVHEKRVTITVSKGPPGPFPGPIPNPGPNPQPPNPGPPAPQPFGIGDLAFQWATDVSIVAQTEWKLAKPLADACRLLAQDVDAGKFANSQAIINDAGKRMDATIGPARVGPWAKWRTKLAGWLTDAIKAKKLDGQPEISRMLKELASGLDKVPSG